MRLFDKGYAALIAIIFFISGAGYLGQLNAKEVGFVQGCVKQTHYLMDPQGVQILEDKLNDFCKELRTR